MAIVTTNHQGWLLNNMNRLEGKQFISLVYININIYIYIYKYIYIHIYTHTYIYIYVFCFASKVKYSRSFVYSCVICVGIWSRQPSAAFSFFSLLVTMPADIPRSFISFIWANLQHMKRWRRCVQPSFIL